MKKILNLGFFIAALMMASCLEEREPSLSFAEGDKLELTYGESKKLQLNYTPHDAVLGTVRWRESNGSVAWADNFGKVYAWGVGESVITAETEIEGVQVTATCLVTVREEKMTSLKLDTTECILTCGQKVKLTATYEPSNPSFPELSWNSSDENIATVNGNGEVSAKNEEGECVITVTNRDSSLTAQCHLYVIPVEMTSLQLSETHRDLEIGKQFKLTASYEPADVTYKDLHWSSSDESVATVSNGMVKAVGLGDCVITVSNRDGSMTAECEVSVYVVEMTSLRINKDSCKIEVGKQFELTALYEPADATYRDLHWSSSDESVVRVVSNGKLVALNVGKCVITVGNKNNSMTAQCEVSVVPVLSLSANSLTLPMTDMVKHLTCKVSPSNTKLKWESSDNSVVTVSDGGYVKPVGEGKAKIVVTALDGSNHFVECMVEVLNAEKYVKDYIENNVSITIDGGGIRIPGGKYIKYKIRNDGDEEVYIEKAQDFSSDYTIRRNVSPRKSIDVEIYSEYELKWTLEMFGISYTKQRNDK